MRLRLGSLTLDTATRQLLRGTSEVHLSPKAFDLLTLLVETRPRAVAKAELQNELWPDVFVSETNLAGLVAADASSLYARNVLDFLKLVIDKEGKFQVPMDDDIVAACLMTQGGEVKRK